MPSAREHGGPHVVAAAAKSDQLSENQDENRQVDLAELPPDEAARLTALVQVVASISASPYPSARILAEYIDRGLPDLVGKVLATVDQENRHRQQLERLREQGLQRRLDRSQIGSSVLGVTGAIGALAAGYLGVPSAICIAVAVLAVGGPNAATVAARLLDRVARDRQG